MARGIAEIRKDLEKAADRLDGVRDELRERRELDATREARLDEAARRCYLGEISKAEEARARAAAEAVVVEIDRLQRVQRMLEEQVAQLRSELHEQECAAAQRLVARTTQELTQLAERILDKYQEIDQLGATMRAQQEAASDALALLHTTMPSPAELVATRRRARLQTLVLY
jgi:hypothetical protein